MRTLLLKHVLPIVLLTYLGLGAVLFLFQKSFIYYPDERAFEDCTLLPRESQITVGPSTRAYFGTPPATTSDILIVYHGNAGNACDRAFLVTNLAEPLGMAWLLVEYTGYAQDGKRPHRDALLENAREVTTWLEAQNVDREFVYGASLGSAVASYHASLRAPDVLIAVSPFPTLTSVARSAYPIYPGVLLREHYDAAVWASTTPRALIIAAADDSLIPPALSRAYFDALTTQDKQFTLIENANHNDLFAEPQFYTTIREFLE
ncbi:hypothetical protein GVX82_01650 [Patescibacteria group bacterium]|jgi:pimeloyl-ACP methyl ester carboxylesterase|nr:hypothetical protein [Patescibacteria group bacterium]